MTKNIVSHRLSLFMARALAGVLLPLILASHGPACRRPDEPEPPSRKGAASKGKRTSLADLLAGREAATSPRGRAFSGGGAPPLKVLGAAILSVEEKYVAPKKIDPVEMLHKALEFVEAERAEIRVTGKRGQKKVIVQVGESSRTFVIESIPSTSALYTQLKEILGWIRTRLEAREKVTPKELTEIEHAAVNGVLSTLDPNSVLMPPKIYDEMQIRTRGAFGGIGIVISIRDGKLTVISPIDSTPAARAGIRAGDHIAKIEDESTVNMPLSDAVARLRGKPGTQVTFWVEREGWPGARRFNIVRERIEIKSVASKVLPGKIGYLRINRFSHHTMDELERHIAKLKAADVRGVVLDLWNNPGGLLQQAEKVADAFLKKGDIVITEAARGVVLRVRKASAKNALYLGPIVVLVNRGSASAAEIVAGALKQQDRAIVIGEPTFGKGTVQMLFENDDGSALKLTVAQYLTPGGISIQGVGVMPDVMTNAVIIRKDWTRMFGHEVDSRRRKKRKDLMPAREQHPAPPLLRLHYLSPESKEKDDKPRYTVAENAADPAVIGLARRLIARYAARRTQMLKANRSFLEAWGETHMSAIVDALAKRGIDWTAPPDGAPKAETGDLQVTAVPEPEGPVKAGDKVSFKVTVKNRGQAPVYRLRGRTAAPSYFLDERELLFGRVAPGTSRTVTLSFEIPTHVRHSIQPLKVILRGPNLSGRHTTRSRLAVTGLPQPRFNLSYRLHDDVEGNGDGRPERGETIRLRVKLTNHGKGPMMDGAVALRNLSGKGIFVIKGRVGVKELAPGKSVEMDLTFRVEQGYEKPRLKLELSAYDNRVRKAVQDHLTMPVAPATATAPGLVGRISQPRIKMEKVPLEVPAQTGTLKISGVARDDRRIRDVYIEVSNFDAEQIRTKVFYQAAPADRLVTRLPFTTAVPLWPGLNTIMVVARESREVMSFRRLVVLRGR